MPPAPRRASQPLRAPLQVVSQEELAALADEYASRRRQDVSARLLGVLRENAGAAAASTAATTVPAPAAAEASTAAVTEGGGAGGADSLVSGYQRLYAVAVLGSLQACLEAPEGEALAALAPLRGAPGSAPFFAAEGISQLEEALAAAAVAAGSSGGTAELEHRLSAQVWPCLPAGACLPRLPFASGASASRSTSPRTSPTGHAFCAGGRRRFRVRAPRCRGPARPASGRSNPGSGWHRLRRRQRRTGGAAG